MLEGSRLRADREEAGAVALADFAECILENSPDGIAAFDSELRVTVWNPVMARLSGIPAAAILGRAMPEACPFLDAGSDSPIRGTLEGRRSSVRNAPFAVAGSARRGFYDADYAPLLRHGNIVGGLVFLRDASDRHSAELRMGETEARFRIMADSAPVMLWMAGLDSECHFFNQGWLRFTGRRLEQEVGTGWAEGIHAEDFQRCMTTYLDAFNRRRAFRMEYRLRRADGEYRWILDQGTPRHDQDGRFAGFIGSCIDVQDFREAQEALRHANDDLEARVQQRTAELRQSNTDLEQFAYAASHDLQEPLRSVASYVQLLARRYRGKLDQDADDFIAYAVEGVTRMRALIHDLLTYSRVSTRGEPLSSVECEHLLAEALASLRVAIEESQASVTHDPLPRVVGDASQLLRVFQNLIGNAIKFRGERPPQVHVSAARKDGCWEIAVRDNGIGIEASYADRIFVIFQRLHGRDRYPGNGIGLAICKKIAERHGGRIWFESEPGRGATFFVSLPVPP